MSVSLRENITAVIESCFSETKEEIQEVAINNILELIRNNTADRKTENSLEKPNNCEPQTIRCPKCGRTDYIRDMEKDMGIKDSCYEYKCINCNTYIKDKPQYAKVVAWMPLKPWKGEDDGEDIQSEAEQ